MNPTVESVLCSIVASIICDIGKYGLGQLKYKKVNFERKDVEKYISEKIDKKYLLLCDSGILLEFFNSPLIMDTINNYITYVITGKLEVKLSAGIKRGKNKNLEESDIIKFLSDNLQKRYIDAKVLTIPEKQLIESFFADVFLLSSNYVLEQLDHEEAAMIYFVNNKINLLGNGVMLKLEEIETILKRSIQTEVVYTDDQYLEDKEYYTKILKDNHRMAHIYLLDKFDINEFYVPPFLTQREGKAHELNFRYYRSSMQKTLYKGGDFDDWKYIFDRSNIVYVTGGAGYGKSLFMKKVIGEYEKLNIVDSHEYIVIYGELKNFFINNTSSPLSVVDFLHNSMKRETLIEDSRISEKLINYYLKSIPVIHK